MHLRMILPMNIPMHYLDIKAYAARHGVVHRTVSNWLAAGKIPGAQKIDGKWAIPADATPTDGPTVITNLPAPTTPEPAAPATVTPPNGGGGFRPRYRPFPIDAVAAEYGVPADTIRRWARDPELPGMYLASGPHAAHYVMVEGV